MRRLLLATALLLAPSSLLHADGAKSKPSSAAFPVLEADGHALHGNAWEQQQAYPSLSQQYGIDQIPAPRVELGAIDGEFYRLQDEKAGSRKPLRIGIQRAVDLSIDMGEWIAVDGGSVWRVDISGLGAMFGRLSVSGIDLADGQFLTMSAPGIPESAVGPIEGRGEFGDGTVYGLAAPSEVARLEWFVPSGQRVKGLPFGGVEFSHGYRDVFGVGFDGGGEGGIAGNCHNDPLCFATWVNEANAATKLIFTSGGGSFLCSGQMMATTAADETPYVSTANHCISTAAEAASCQFIFFFRNSPCGGAIVAGTTVTGADLTSTYLASDCTLLMIRPTLPAAAYWAGWTNVNPAVNTASTCIHHPGGAEQAISFGVKNANSFNCGAPTTNWHSLSWNNGITEGGSSGSAIYRDSDKRLYGVLTCGASACTNTAGDDGYGRWDVAVNTGGFAALLAAGADDAQEQNDTCATARPVTAGTSYANMVVKRLDEDWYAIPLSVGSTMSMTMTFTHANGDVDLQLFSDCAGGAVVSRVADTNNEVFTYTNLTASNTIYMRVYLGADTRNNYTFSYTVTTPPPANDDCLSAEVVGLGSFAFNTAAATNSTPTIAASCTDGAGVTLNKDVWFRFIPECDGTATISTCGLAAFDTRLVVYAGTLNCPGAATAVYACNDDGAGCTALTSTVSFPCNASQQFYVRLGSKAVVGGSGTVSFSCTPAAPPCPADVDGSGAVDGADLAALLGSWGACAGCAADVDGSGTIDGADLAAVLGSWGACP